MSSCFCSTLKPSIANREPKLFSRWAPNPNIKPVQFFNLQTHGKYFSSKAVHTDGVGVIYSDDTVSDRRTPLDAEPESQANGVFNGVEATATEESHDARSQVGFKRSQEKKGDAEESDEASRFKLRNGREVSISICGKYHI